MDAGYMCRKILLGAGGNRPGGISGKGLGGCRRGGVFGSDRGRIEGIIRKLNHGIK